MLAVGWNYRRLADAGSRRRIRVVVAGLIAACTPYVVVVVVAYRVFALIDEMTYRFWYPVTFLAMLCIPAAVATAVWKEQLFDVRVFVRRGLQYLLARTALRALLALPMALLAFSIVSHPDRTVAQILTQGSGWLNIVWIGAIAAALQSRQRLQTSLDRRFFREAYHQEQVLVQLIDEVRQVLLALNRSPRKGESRFLRDARTCRHHRDSREAGSTLGRYRSKTVSRPRCTPTSVETRRMAISAPSTYGRALLPESCRMLSL